MIPLADARSDASASDASSPPVAGLAASRPTASDPTASNPTASHPAASGRATSAGADPDGDVGVRDVWKAARARRRALRAEMRRFTVGSAGGARSGSPWRPRSSCWWRGRSAPRTAPCSR
ncbi:hypothetical protein [Microbacterium elymi]|uniref:Uncharacterized protein n=1 Tax=Microbacterium elymi TaxID=2909587 RepID=A0ABY5NJ65_9MICO|nr:hypothetical protein [Microbacterium elymi]UUT35205.1 hypothetical protein L2X98_33845 [Microbacterium elymi]